jgi:hypothetical protein
MNPSRYQLPQYVSDDRRRARADTLRREQARFEIQPDDPEGGLPEGFRRLPPKVKQLPSDMEFPGARITELAWDRLLTGINVVVATVTSGVFPLTSVRGYRALFRVVEGPHAIMNRWREDSEFGRQRLTGVDPMHLHQLRDDEPTALWEAGKRVLSITHPRRPIEDMYRKHRLFYVDYAHLWHPRVREHVPKGAHLGAPRCLFWADDYGNPQPLAIQLKPPREPRNPVFTPLDPVHDWMMARCHVQAAESHQHEGTYHLLETHLVSGAVALCMYRRLHPDHPVRQLLEPHYEYNLAINELALTGLLAKGGTIDTALAAGVAGTLQAARIHYAGWSFPHRSPSVEIALRGVEDRGTLPHYYYRDDALEVHGAIDQYVGAILGLWYRTDADVVNDDELQAWLAEVASPRGGDIPGFPAALHSRERLFELCTELIFRAGPQHAAVNNGQFDAYGWIPGTPGIVFSALPDEPSPPEGHFTEREFWRALPKRQCTLAQMGMVWVLSAPTLRTLLHAGESPAFHPSLSMEADHIIGAFRRRLWTISESIGRRNATLDVPYRYLDPQNISRSTDI